MSYRPYSLQMAIVTILIWVLSHFLTPKNPRHNFGMLARFTAAYTVEAFILSPVRGVVPRLVRGTGRLRYKRAHSALLFGLGDNTKIVARSFCSEMSTSLSAKPHQNGVSIRPEHRCLGQHGRRASHQDHQGPFDFPKQAPDCKVERHVADGSVGRPEGRSSSDMPVEDAELDTYPRKRAARSGPDDLVERM